MLQAAVATVDAHTTPPQTQVLPNTTGEHTQEVALKVPQTSKFALGFGQLPIAMLPPQVIVILTLLPAVKNLINSE